MLSREVKMKFERIGMPGTEAQSTLNDPTEWILRYRITYLCLF